MVIVENPVQIIKKEAPKPVVKTKPLKTPKVQTKDTNTSPMTEKSEKMKQVTQIKSPVIKVTEVANKGVEFQQSISVDTLHDENTFGVEINQKVTMADSQAQTQ